jgi:hypothetical protein
MIEDKIPMPKIPLWRRNDVGNAIYEFCIWYLYKVDTRSKIGILLMMPLVLTIMGFLLYAFGMMFYMMWDLGTWIERLIIIVLGMAGLGCFIMRRDI